MNSIFNLRLFYKDIDIILHGYAYTNLEGDLDNRRFTYSYVFLYDYACIS